MVKPAFEWWTEKVEEIKRLRNSVDFWEREAMNQRALKERAEQAFRTADENLKLARGKGLEQMKLKKKAEQRVTVLENEIINLTRHRLGIGE